MSLERQRPAAQRAATLAAVALLHLAFVAILVTQSGVITYLGPSEMLTRIIPSTTPKLPKPPEIKPQLPPILMPVPIPRGKCAALPNANLRAARHHPRRPPRRPFRHRQRRCQPRPRRRHHQQRRRPRPRSPGEFEAAVKRAVLQRKRQPSLAWDRRNTCVVNYTVKIARDGSLAGLSIDPCAIPEINDAARNAIREAAPFPAPPDLGAPTV